MKLGFSSPQRSVLAVGKQRGLSQVDWYTKRWIGIQVGWL